MANKKDFSALGLCEVMMRLSPSGKERISKTHNSTGIVSEMDR